MVRKLIVVVVFVSLNTGVWANVEMVGSDSLTYPRQKVVTIDTLVKKFDNLVRVSQDCLVLVEEGVKADGPKVYFQKHNDVFLPIIAFLVLYMFWWKKR